MLLLAIALACGPLSPWSDSQMHKQMESRSLVATREDVLFQQNHAEIGPMSTGLHPVSQTTKYLSPYQHPTVTQPWVASTAHSIQVSCSARIICVYFIRQFKHPELQAAGRELSATERTRQKTGQGRREGAMLGFNEKGGKEYVPEAKEHSRKKDRKENNTKREKGKET